MAKFPAKIGDCIDRVYEMRNERTALQKKYEDEISGLKERETDLKNHIVTLLEKNGLESGRGDEATATITTNIYPRVTDWDKVYAWVKKTGAFEIFEKRILRSAFKERYEAREGIPGIDAFEDKDLSLTKAAAKK